jgi:hypothetical protein
MLGFVRPEFGPRYITYRFSMSILTFIKSLMSYEVVT